MTPGTQATRKARRAGLLGCLAAAAASLSLLAPISADADQQARAEVRQQAPTEQPLQPAERPSAAFNVLQLNLCHSGHADCYAGGESVDSAIKAIADRKPAVVTLNEVCAHDITEITRKTGYQGEFTPAGDEQTGGPYQCSDGRGDYGIGILSHPDQGGPGEDIVERPYQTQDSGNEQRVLLCVPYSKFSACTTHLSADSGNVAAKQCQELTEVAGRLPRPTVIGGDFNLTYGGDPDVQDCVPGGWFRKGDGAVQHWFATNSYRFEGTEKLPIQGTDHPGLLVKLTR